MRGKVKISDTFFHFIFLLQIEEKNLVKEHLPVDLQMKKINNEFTVPDPYLALSTIPRTPRLTTPPAPLSVMNPYVESPEVAPGVVSSGNN